MSLHVIARIVAAAGVVAGVTSFAPVDIKGDYNVEFTVGENPYTGTAKTTAGAKSTFSGKLTFTSPSPVDADVTGKTVGDSIMFDAKYVDSGRNCTGTVSAKGTAEKDGNKASGALSIKDSCEGDITGTFRLWR
jgi:hypothetical protein